MSTTATMAHVKSSSRALRSSTPFITFTIAYAIYTDAFLYAAIVPVAPFALQRQVAEDKVQVWVAILLGSFGVGCFVSSVPWGYYADRCTSRRTPFLLGLLVLLVTTGMLWFAPYVRSNGLVVQFIARLLQGFASTIVWMTGLAILVDLVGHTRIGEYSGYIGIALNLGNLTGPLLGGVVFAKSGYHAVFGLVTGVVVIDILLRLGMREPAVRRPVRAAASTDITSPLQAHFPNTHLEKAVSRELALANTVSPPEDGHSTMTTSSCPSSVSRLPVMLRLLFSVRFMAAVWGIMVLAMVYTGFETVLPMAVNKVFGWNSEGGGLVFLPLSVPSLLGPLVGKFTDRYGGRWVTAAAFATICPALILLRLVNENSINHKVLLCALLVVIGSCLTLILEPLFAEITGRATALEAADAGILSTTVSGRGYYAQAYAHFNWSWALGNTLGPILSGFIAESQGWKTAMLCMGVLCGVSAVPMVLWIDGWIREKR